MDHTGTRRHGSSGTTNKTKRPTFQSKARLLADSCIGYIVNTFARLWGARDWGVESQVIKFEQVCSAHMRKPLVDRLTDMTENITFPHYVAGDNNRNNSSYLTTVTLFFVICCGSVADQLEPCHVTLLSITLVMVPCCLLNLLFQETPVCFTSS